MFAGVCLIFGISAGTSWSGEQHGGMGKSRGGGSGTWVRQPKPGSLGQNVPTGVRPGQVAVDGGVRGEDVGHRQHVAEQPAQGEPQQHLPITRSSGVPLGYGRVPGTAWGGGGTHNPSATITGSPKTPTYREDLEEVDRREVALLASLVRRQRHRDILQVLREQNYKRNSPRRRENQTVRQSGRPAAHLSPH